MINCVTEIYHTKRLENFHFTLLRQDIQKRGKLFLIDLTAIFDIKYLLGGFKDTKADCGTG